MESVITKRFKRESAKLFAKEMGVDATESVENISKAWSHGFDVAESLFLNCGVAVNQAKKNGIEDGPELQNFVKAWMAGFLASKNMFLEEND